MYVYLTNRDGNFWLYTVGFYKPNGDWEPESDHNDSSELDTIKGAKPMTTFFDDDQPWRNWKHPQDAILWAEAMLPHYSLDEIQAEFNALEAQNGKKALAWVARINHLMQENF